MSSTRVEDRFSQCCASTRLEAASHRFGADAVGERVAVNYGKHGWYEGNIGAFNAGTDLYRVDFDTSDGHEYWVPLDKQVRFVGG